VIKKKLKIKDGPILGELLKYLSMELAYKRLNNFDEAIYKAKRWIEQNAPKCD
jgi:tRNA nucleotidyltransferase (CCA-adding enzyme)